MKDSNPSKLYLNDKKRQYVKLKSQLIDAICDYRILLNNYLVEKYDRVQYEINEINQFHCQFRLINQVIVDLSEKGIEYNLQGEMTPTENQLDDIKQKGNKIQQLVVTVMNVKRSMKAGAENG